MQKISDWLRLFSGRQDIILAVILILAVFMIILPLPTLLIDILIAVNLTISLLLMMIAVYVRQPLEFSSFPAVLLITTLYRLSLSISTTRLILLQHDAGDIVYTFGNFVVGGNLGIGLIIFSIITIVQFIVITKGSERVAEVGARFSLDGMPGKQMSIDGDMRAGTIDAHEARRQRSMVQKESQLYGAMDGAMKFVKGDAIAGMIIVMVNIFGGVAVGMFVHGMSASQAMQTYAILSVGDGLISQIPALLISITAGIIVTRVPGQERQNLASEMVEQMANQPRPLFLASGMLLLFALLPGFPTLVFLTLSLGLGIGGWALIGKPWWGKKQTITAMSASGQPQSDDLKPGSVPLMLILPENLVSPTLEKALTLLRWRMFERLGIIIPQPPVRMVSAGEPCRIDLYQEAVASLPLQGKESVWRELPSTEAGSLNPVTLFPGRTLWLSDSAESTEPETTEVWRDDARFTGCLELVINRYAKEFIGVQETRVLMDAMEQDYGELVKEVQRQLPLGKIADILQRLVEEGISIRDLRTIFETVIVWAVKEKDTVILTEYVRSALRRHIVHRYSKGEQWLDVWVIGNAIEEQIRESIRQTSAGTYSALEPDEVARIVGQVKAVLGEAHSGLLITALDVRRYLRKMIERELIDVHVVSFQEIGDAIELNVLGNIELIGGLVNDPSLS
ncbi:type III secretion system export apparatus subunit SctV [Enterobacteriaceae bacterium H20N1]|uniref:Type III secretion system export apparatus subunit SctV n=1 Tax=Dryocola boscaweniae TaxID=2925397 RepID=A0A9X2W460_9ENTR|nr:type III secretion system export apparatus subunit SctV [Dryocola boscaweniae]MCT4700524.1 type III secretion system export apparatus subunit SctV [Dryocola boscaweniae]MCT4717680.1 type III secretion system export apparatus subunit SctV [Dryocola boscaweniae]